MGITFSLYRLQQIDSRLDEIQHRLGEIAALLGDQSTLNAARSALQQHEEQCTAAARAQKKLEDELQAVRRKKSANQQRLYSGQVKNPKALQDLQEEAAALTRRINELEDRLLEAMLQREEICTARDQAQAALHELQARLGGQQAVWLDEQRQLEEENDRLQAQRATLLTQIAATALEQYETLRQRKRGRAVARIDEGACEACGAMLPPSLIQQARQGQAHCSSCGRILYAG